MHQNPLTYVPGMTGPPNSFTVQSPVTLTAILFTQKDTRAVYQKTAYQNAYEN